MRCVFELCGVRCERAAGARTPALTLSFTHSRTRQMWRRRLTASPTSSTPTLFSFKSTNTRRSLVRLSCCALCGVVCRVVCERECGVVIERANPTSWTRTLFSLKSTNTRRYMVRESCECVSCVVRVRRVRSHDTCAFVTHSHQRTHTRTLTNRNEMRSDHELAHASHHRSRSLQ